MKKEKAASPPRCEALARTRHAGRADPECCVARQKERGGRSKSSAPFQPRCSETRCDVMLLNRFHAGLGPAPIVLLYRFTGINASSVSRVHFGSFLPTRLDHITGFWFPTNAPRSSIRKRFPAVLTSYTPVIRGFFLVTFQHASVEQIWLSVSLRTSPSFKNPFRPHADGQEVLDYY